MTVLASKIASFLELEFNFFDFEVRGPSSLGNPKECTISFVSGAQLEQKLEPKFNSILYLVDENFTSTLDLPILRVDNPRLKFAQVMSKFFVQPMPPSISKTAVLHPASRISNTASIGEYTVIEENVIIGDLVEIGHNVVIHSNTKIGDGSVIGSNTVIGSIGLGFERDENNAPIRIPHVGGVIIGEDVEIGSCSTVAKGTIDDTIISSMVKIDDHVFIAHNVYIGPRSILVAGSEVSGSVKIDEDCWIGPLSTIRDGLTIGKKSIIGMGAVVTKNVHPETTVAGNPARRLSR